MAATYKNRDKNKVEIGKDFDVNAIVESTHIRALKRADIFNRTVQEYEKERRELWNLENVRQSKQYLK